jgi:iron complex outermembrane receptor protein
MSRVWMVILALSLPSVALADPKDDARRHFTSGLEAAQRGDYEVALQHFLAAQEAYPHPATLYNIARSYQDLNDLTNALTYYRLYRDAMPEKAGDIDPVIAVIEAKLRQESGAPTVGTSSGQGQQTVVIGGVSPEVLSRLQTLAQEMQAKVDEVNALTSAIAEGQASAVTPVEGGATGGTEGGGTAEGGGGDPTEIPEIPGGGFITDAYQRIVVTASRYGQDPLDSPSSVTILTDEDIRLSGAQTLPDVLRRAVGVEAMALAASHTDLSIRGFNRELNNKVLVLVDGRSVYMDAVGSNFLANLPISIDEIERIEIIRGPGSAVYGANAVTGVINIITKTPGEGGNLVRVDAGTTGYGQGTLMASGRAGGNAYRFSAGYTQLGRWAKEYDPGLSGREFNATDEDISQTMLRMNGRIDRTFLDKGFASVSAGLSDGSFEYYNIGALGNYYFDERYNYVRGDIAYGNIHLRAFWNQDVGVTDAWTEPKDWVRSFESALNTDTYDAELEGSQEFETGPVTHRLNAGVGYRRKHTYLPGYIPGEIFENHYSAFINEEATIDRLKITASLRADRHPWLPLSQTLSPRGAAILRVAEDTSVRVTGGTAFRAPNHIENYMGFVLPASSDAAFVMDYGSTELAPERIVTAEMGIHDESTVYHTADVAVYVNQLTDIIYLTNLQSPLTFDPPEVGFDDEQNGYLAGKTGWTNLDDRYLGYGLEAEGDLFPVDGLDIYGNVALERVLRSSEGEEAVADRSAPLLKVNTGVTYRTPFRTDLSLHANYVSEQVWGQRLFDATGQIIVVESTIPSRLILSARVGVRPLPDNESLEIAAGVWNAGGFLESDDVDSLVGAFQEHPKGQPVGGRAYGSLVYKF